MDGKALSDIASAESGGNVDLSLVVGVGASAGGLEAFKQLLPVLPATSGMAFILVQHLDPKHESLLRELLAPSTKMAVKDAEQGDELQANVIYVIRPNTALAVRNGKIELTTPLPQGGGRGLVDHLFRSLAHEFGARAVGIILSGAGSDGSLGMHDIKGAGGLTMAEDPSTCFQTGMPQSAIDHDAVELVLPIDEMPAALLRFQNLPPSVRAEPADGMLVREAEEGKRRLELDDKTFERVAALLQNQVGFNLRAYKSTTVARRVVRRMTLAGYDDVDAYLNHLREDQAEQQTLVRELFINLTNFFRDPEAFDALRAMVIEPLVEEIEAGGSLRAWVAGCATGEEAYSIAMEFLDAMERHDKPLRLRIFATDVHEDALAVGRAGFYPSSIASQVRQDRLQKYFDLIDGRGYQVRSQLRDTVSFSVHDLTRDPPFSHMHLVSCRNLLIYLRGAAQEHVLKCLHFALEPNSYLFLGSSESIGSVRELFSTLSKSWRIFRKIGASRPVEIPEGGARMGSTRIKDGSGVRINHMHMEVELPEQGNSRMTELARQAVMTARVPPTVVVAEPSTILFMHGELRPYLRFPVGGPRFDLATLLTPELATRVRAALYKCRRDKETVIAFSSPKGSPARRTRITANPAFELGEGTVVLSFEETDEESPTPPSTPETDAQEVVIEELENELQATREKLRSANEESSSMSEEMQSTNEELEATTEELRSLNEELSSVNAQLRDKVAQLELAHGDLSNLFESTRIATLFLDEGLCIKRFTPAARELLRVGEGDKGRFVGDIARDLLQNGLVEEAQQVLAHLSGKTRELHTQGGAWIVRRVLPYQTESRRIEGVVVTLVDITELKVATELLAVRERQQAVIARLTLCALEATDLQSFLDQTVREVQQTLESDFCKILELQPGEETFLLRAGIGWKSGLVGQASVPGGLDSQAGYTLKAQSAITVEDLRTERRFTGPLLLSEHGVRSGLSCVVSGTDEDYGVIGVHTRQLRVFTREDANFLQAVATVITGALNRFETRTRLALEGAAAKALAEADSLIDAFGRIQASAANELGTLVGELWQPTGEGELERSSVFATPPYTEEQVIRKFGPPRCSASEGLLARVFTSRHAEWSTVFENEVLYPRVQYARNLGLASGLALPIVDGTSALGVMTFFSRKKLHAARVFLRSLEAIGRSIGDFMHRLEGERRFRMTIDNAPVGILVRALDGRWLRMNDRFCEITGYAREEMLDQPYFQFTHPEDQKREQELYTELREGRRDKFTLEKRYIRKDGSPIWVNLSCAMVRKPSGKQDYCVVVVEDISTRRAAEEDLRESEARLRRILLDSPTPMMVYEEQGAILALNHSWTEVTGYTSEELPTIETWIVKAFRERAPELRKVVEGIWSDASRGQKNEAEIWTKAGETRTLVLTSVPLGETREGRRLRVVVAMDVTEQRRFEQQLLDADRQKDEFIAMLGHELRNPLSAVRTTTELLKRSHPEDARIQRMQTILERQTNHMAKLLDGLLDISRIIHGKIVLEKRVVDLATLVRDTARDLSQQLPAGLELHVELGEEPIFVEGDPVRLTQVVDNLLTNAIKYTPPPGTITVQVAKEDERGVLKVRDTGSGIEPELLPNLFNAFQQGRQSLDRSKGGLGLGLALVKTLAELHGGTVEAHSEGPGTGAEFIVRIPLTAQEPLRSGGKGRRAGRLRVLVIEDNEDAAEALREALEFDGHEVAVASQGSLGIELARELVPDIVLCDLGLPGDVTGFDVARALRADPRTRPMYLVAVTGYGSPEDKIRCVQAGFDAHLTKPVSFDTLNRFFSEALERASS